MSLGIVYCMPHRRLAIQCIKIVIKSEDGDEISNNFRTTTVPRENNILTTLAQPINARHYIIIIRILYTIHALY